MSLMRFKTNQVTARVFQEGDKAVVLSLSMHLVQILGLLLQVSGKTERLMYEWQGSIFVLIE